jgi:hypothetical protein
MDHEILHKKTRTTADQATFWGSDAYRQLDADCGHSLSKDGVHSIILTIGGDGVQLLNWGSRTATVVGIKCEDLPSHLVQKGKAVKPLLVMEGPQEPSILNHAMVGVAEFFVKHVPSSNGTGANRKSLSPCVVATAERLMI